MVTRMSVNNPIELTELFFLKKHFLVLEEENLTYLQTRFHYGMPSEAELEK